MKLKYQLVFQLLESCLVDFEALISFEAELIDVLREGEVVDGHDMGSGEANIFVFTDDPRATFQRAKSVLENAGYLMNVIIAYRNVEGEDFTVIWPENCAREFTVA